MLREPEESKGKDQPADSSTYENISWWSVIEERGGALKHNYQV